MIDNKTVGRKIAAMRQENALTQQQLASLMNVSHQAVSKWESGQTLPDIQTMLELTRFFGITVEQLVSDEEIPAADVYPEAPESDTNTEENTGTVNEREVRNMGIQQLLQMAPYMSKETVEEIVMEIEGELTANQIARVAPYIRPEYVEKLIAQHHPELTWESLRRIAPYMRREAVDALAKDIASGKENVKPASENINKAFNDLGRAFDDLGHDMKHAVKKGLRFGKSVIREVSSALSERANEEKKSCRTEPVRSERAYELRQKAFERAMNDGKWDWIESHIDELDNHAELRSRIAEAAREAGMHDWICKHMGAYADAATIDAAITTGNWDWLGMNAHQLDPEVQAKVARAACGANNWQWLTEHSDRLVLKSCGREIAAAAVAAGERSLALQLAENHLLPEEITSLALAAGGVGDDETLDMMIHLCSDAGVETLLQMFAMDEKWERVTRYMHLASAETAEKLMELAVDQGNFDAVDLLDQYM